MTSFTEAHLPCPCGQSSDAYAVNGDGWGTCFSCSKRFPPEGEAPAEPTVKYAKPLVPFGSYQALAKRKIREETCQRFGYFVSTDDTGRTIQVAQYRNAAGHICGQKVRTANKKFRTTGAFQDVVLYGQHLWKEGGRRVVITEGEIDCLSLAQAFGLSWPVVSLPNGAASARKALEKSVAWLSTYDQVVLCFDQDDAGRRAAEDCITVLPPGKIAIAELPLKDANEMLVAGRVKELTTAIWEAQVRRPDGIVTVADVRKDLTKPIEKGKPWCFATLTGYTYGRRYGELYALGAGTGVGKSDFLTQQIAYDATELREKSGVFFLEQQPIETLRRVAGKVVGKRFWVPDGSWTPDELNEAVDCIDGLVFMYDHFGTTDWDIIERRIRFLHATEGVRSFYLDHLTALAAQQDDERAALENIMAALGKLVKELDIMVLIVSHLATPDGKPHEEGGRVMIRHFKGSRAIGFWPHFIFGLERDQQDQETPWTTFRVLKDRYTGTSTGKTFELSYDPETGLLSERGDNLEAADLPF